MLLNIKNILAHEQFKKRITATINCVLKNATYPLQYELYKKTIPNYFN